MDIHRSRFVPYPTSAISALAFSRSSDSGYSGPLPALKLALGRANGNVEIWNPQNGSWVQEAVFPGDNRSIDGLAWTQDADEVDAEGKRIPGQQRLFSIASSPSVTEWDLATGMPKRQSTGNFSEVWCFAAQPRLKQKTADEEAPAQEIVAGCGDGTIVLLSTADNDLQFKRFLARVGGKRARCMCVAYQNRERVAVGFADAMVRIYDTRNGALLRGMSLGVSLPGMPKNAMVWQVKCLPNGDIVTADSNGEVRFWDGRTYSLSQRIAGHETDCLDLVTSSDGKTVFSGSIDGKIAVYRQSTQDQGRKYWARSSHRRVQNGEVKSMAAFDSKSMSVVVSGGSDVAPMVTPLRECGKENIRSLPTLPQEPPVTSAPKARLMVSWWAWTISIWRFAGQAAMQDAAKASKPRKLVAKITLDTKEAIRSVSISPDGRVIAASTNSEVKVFQLKKRAESDGLGVRKLSVSGDLATGGSRIVVFSPDGKWLASATPDSEVYVARLAEDPQNPKRIILLDKTVELERRHRKNATQSALKHYDQSIARLTFSPDSSVLVAADMSGHLDSWVLEGHEDLTAPAIDTAKYDSANSSAAQSGSSSSDSDSDDDDTTTIFHGQHWTANPSGHLLPKLDSVPLLLTFRPSSNSKPSLTNGNPGIHATRHNPHAHSHELPQGQHNLVVLTSKHQIYELDVLAGRLSDWSRRNPSTALPEDFRKIRDRVMGGVWDRERLWLYGSSFVCMVDVGRDLDGDAGGVQRKRRRKAKGEEEDEPTEVLKRRKLESGAGGRINGGAQSGAEQPVKRFENGKEVELRSEPPAKKQSDEAEDDDDDEEDDEVNFALSRTKSEGGGLEKRDAESTSGERRWWCTFKYRPILGIVPLEREEGDENGPLEVVLVERPVWDRGKEGM